MGKVLKYNTRLVACRLAFLSTLTRTSIYRHAALERQCRGCRNSDWNMLPLLPCKTQTKHQGQEGWMTRKPVRHDEK